MSLGEKEEERSAREHTENKKKSNEFQKKYQKAEKIIIE